LNLCLNREFVISEAASSSLTHLTLDPCFSNDVPQLLHCCINLHSLTLKVEQSRRRSPFVNMINLDQQYNSLPIICSYLTYFSIDIYDLTFSDIQFFLSIMPHLIRFRIEGLSYDMDFSKGDLWQKTFEKMTKKLKQFDITGIRLWLGNNANNDGDNVNLINQIILSFGSNHNYWGKQWFVHQAHKLRANHLNLTLQAKAL
jgi:hypothetical protein